MAYEVPGFSYTLVSGADYRTGNGQFRFVTVAPSGKGLQSIAGSKAIGVRQNTPNTDEGITVVMDGITMVESGAAFAPGDFITSDATGRAVEAAAGDFINAVALETSSAAGLPVAVRLLNSASKA